MYAKPLYLPNQRKAVDLDTPAILDAFLRVIILFSIVDFHLYVFHYQNIAYIINGVKSMTDKNRIKQAEELERQAAKLRKQAERKLPDFWRVGQKVRYLEDREWAWSKGETAEVIKLRDEYKKTPGDQYQVFYTGNPKSDFGGSYWTTPNDVELVEDV